jgi:hypothetical protein
MGYCNVLFLENRREVAGSGVDGVLAPKLIRAQYHVICSPETVPLVVVRLQLRTRLA